MAKDYSQIGIFYSSTDITKSDDQITPEKWDRSLYWTEVHTENGHITN